MRLAQILLDTNKIEVIGQASNITTAMMLVEEKQPDVVIIDIHLKDDAPKANGINLLSMIKEQHPEIATIMLTNLATKEYEDKCKSIGANYLFDKTNDFECIPTTLTKLER